MAKMELESNAQEPTGTGASGKKLRTRDLIYAGAFGAIYLVVMLLIVFGMSTVPILYLTAALPVGIVCGTIYEMCVLKVRKFGAALILGVLFAVISCLGAGIAPFVLAVVFALLRFRETVLTRRVLCHAQLGVHSQVSFRAHASASS